MVELEIHSLILTEERELIKKLVKTRSKIKKKVNKTNTRRLNIIYLKIECYLTCLAEFERYILDSFEIIS